MKDKSDHFFKKILDTLRHQKPNDLQVQKWKNSVQRELQSPDDYPFYIKKTPLTYWSQLVSAVCVGILIGGLIFKYLNNKEKDLQIAYKNATMETVYTNF